MFCCNYWKLLEFHDTQERWIDLFQMALDLLCVMSGLLLYNELCIPATGDSYRDVWNLIYLIDMQKPI